MGMPLGSFTLLFLDRFLLDVRVLTDYYFKTCGYLGGVVYFGSRSTNRIGEILAAGRYNLDAEIVVLHKLLRFFR